MKASVIILGWSLTPVIGEYLVDKTSQVTAYQLSFFRYLIAAITIYIILMVQRKVTNKEILSSFKTNWWKYLIVSIFCAFMPVFLFLSVNTTTASTASFLLNSNVVLIPIISYFVLKERIRKSYFLALVFALVGLFFVIFDKNILNLSNLPLGTIEGNLLAFGSGVSWALYTIFLKKFFAKDNPLMVTFISLFMASIYLVFFAFLVTPADISLDLFGVFLLLVIAILGTSFAYSLWLDILSYLTTTETGILQVLVPIFSVIWSVAFLEEGKELTYFFGIGAFLIIISIIVFEFERGRAKFPKIEENKEN